MLDFELPPRSPSVPARHRCANLIYRVKYVKQRNLAWAAFNNFQNRSACFPILGCAALGTRLNPCCLTLEGGNHADS